MGTKVNIMDMQVDLLTKETLKQEMQNFLENETVNVVHVISLDYMDAYDKNEQVRESLAHADLVLPGEKSDTDQTPCRCIGDRWHGGRLSCGVRTAFACKRE